MPREGASLGAQTLVDNCQFLQAEKMLGSVSHREVLPAKLASRWIRSVDYLAQHRTRTDDGASS